MSDSVEPRSHWDSLASKAQAGDKRAYASLLQDILPFIRSVLAGTISHNDWIDDIAQEVLISVHKSLYTYTPDRPFKPWLVSIIKFRRSDFLRSHYKHIKYQKINLQHAKFLEDPVTKSMLQGESKDIEAAMNGLPEKQREILELMKIQGFSIKDVAEKTGMSASAIKVSAHRAIVKLKGTLE